MRKLIEDLSIRSADLIATFHCDDGIAQKITFFRIYGNSVLPEEFARTALRLKRLRQRRTLCGSSARLNGASQHDDNA